MDRVAKEKMDEIISKLEEIFIDGLIIEVLLVYSDLVIRRNDTNIMIQGILDDYIELFEDTDYFGNYTWIALAYFQHQIGRLTKQIQNKAIKVIDKELDRYYSIQEPLLSNNQLVEFKNVILSEMPPKLKVGKPKKFQVNWKDGDVFAFKLDGDIVRRGLFEKEDVFPNLLGDYNLMNKYIMVLKIKDYETFYKNICPLVLIFNWYGDEPLKNLDELKKYGFIPVWLTEIPWIYYCSLEEDYEEDFRFDKFEYIGNIKINVKKPISNNEIQMSYSNLNNIINMMVKLGIGTVYKDLNLSKEPNKLLDFPQEKRFKENIFD